MSRSPLAPSREPQAASHKPQASSCTQSWVDEEAWVDENESVVDEQEQEGGVSEASAGRELESVREVVLRAHPDVVPELVAGGSVAELLASVEPARAAYARIVEARPAVVEETVVVPVVPVVPPVVPAGSATNVVDPATLPAQELIRRGIEAERRKGGKAARQG